MIFESIAILGLVTLPCVLLSLRFASQLLKDIWSWICRDTSEATPDAKSFVEARGRKSQTDVHLYLKVVLSLLATQLRRYTSMRELNTMNRACRRAARQSTPMPSCRSGRRRKPRYITVLYSPYNALRIAGWIPLLWLFDFRLVSAAKNEVARYASPEGFLSQKLA